MISAGAHFQVVSSFLTVRQYNESRGFFIVPAGATVVTAGELQPAGLIPIRVSGELLLAFSRDLRERTRYMPTAGDPQEWLEELS